MDEHRNIALLRRGYDAFAVADMATLDGLFADDVTWHVAGRSPLAGTYKGKEQVFGFFGRLAELTGGTFTATIETILGDDEHVITTVHHTGSREGRTLATRDVLVFRMEGERVVEVDHTSFDPYGTDAFWE